MDRPLPPFASTERPIQAEDVSAAAGCLHRWYLECHGNPALRRSDDPPDPGKELFQRHCVAWLTDLREPAWNGRDPLDGHRETVKLLEQGAAWIFRGVLVRDGLLSRPDLLRKIDRRSALGPFSYAPAAILRRSTGVGDAEVTELQLHAMALRPILGHSPSSAWVYSPDGTSREIPLQPSLARFRTLIADLERIRRGELLTEGYRCAGCRRCPWQQQCRTVWSQLSHVCLLPGMETADIGAFRDGGYASWPAVAASSPERMARQLGLPLPRARLLWLHAKAFQSRRPLLIQPAPPPIDLPIHFYTPEFRNGRCALHGDLRVERGEVRVRQFLASTPAQERAAWQAFLDHLARDERAIVFSWNDRVAGALDALWTRHGGDARGWRHLKQGRRSLHRFLRQQVILPLTDYSLTEVAAFFSFKGSPRPVPTAAFPQPWERDHVFPEIAPARALIEANRERITALKSIYFALQRLNEFGCTETA